MRDQALLARSLAERERIRDADGRFRINNFFCHADSWQAAVPHLIDNGKAVLMDLRSFSATSAGCIHELRYLVKTCRSAAASSSSTQQPTRLSQAHVDGNLGCAHARLAKLPTARGGSCDPPLCSRSYRNAWVAAATLRGQHGLAGVLARLTSRK